MNRAKRFTYSVLVLTLLGTLTACASLNRLRDTGDCVDNPCLAQQQEELARLLRHAEQVRRMNEPARQRAYALAEQAFAHEASAANRLRLALLQTLPDTSFQCESCARDLLREYLQDGRAWHDFAALLLHATEQRLALRQDLETERKQHQQARQQLEKLKVIEQRINDRDRAATPKPETTP